MMHSMKSSINGKSSCIIKCAARFESGYDVANDVKDKIVWWNYNKKRCFQVLEKAELP